MRSPGKFICDVHVTLGATPDVVPAAPKCCLAVSPSQAYTNTWDSLASGSHIDYFYLLHQGDKGAIGMPGRVVSWPTCPCLRGEHGLLLHAGLSSVQGKVLPRATSGGPRKRKGGHVIPVSSLYETTPCSSPAYMISGTIVGNFKRDCI